MKDAYVLIRVRGQAPRLTAVRRLRASFDGRKLMLPTIAQSRPAEAPRLSAQAASWRNILRDVSQKPRTEAAILPVRDNGES
jgi:hypothetical protein